MDNRTNIYDVARAAGTSRTVVSLVINGKADKYRISKETQERVRAAVRETGYTPNLTLRNMFLNRRLGLDPEAVRRMDAARLITILEPVLAEKGYRLAAVADTVLPETRDQPAPAPVPPIPQPIQEKELSESVEETPKPVTVSEPESESDSIPVPESALEPAPEQAPVTESEPEPVPEPTPEPQPQPEPGPEPIPEPVPQPEPEPERKDEGGNLKPEEAEETPEPATSAVEPPSGHLPSDGDVEPTPPSQPDPLPSPPAPAPEPDPAANTD